MNWMLVFYMLTSYGTVPINMGTYKSINDCYDTDKKIRDRYEAIKLGLSGMVLDSVCLEIPKV